MESEADLIRSGNWTALRRHYAKKSGHAWEEAWLSLSRLSDEKSAIQSFQKSLDDPRFEEASYIMLRRLGQKGLEARVSLAPTLKLYEAYKEGELRPFLSYFLSEEVNWSIAAAVFQRVLKSKKAIHLEELKLLPLSKLDGTAAFYVGQIFNRRFRDTQSAHSAFRIFLQDLWVGRVLKESRRQLLDEDFSRRLRNAYAQKDGQTVRRLLKALSAKLKKLNLPPLWEEAFEIGIQTDLKSLTENLLGYAFWKSEEWSPEALFEMKQRAFPEERKTPDFVAAWDSFFSAKNWKTLPPLALEPDRLSLWQIVVELDSSRLSEALLRFPNEERFLFLWTLRNQNEGGRQKSLWPSDETESEVVRKNLQRAFERSTNKLLWFDRLRASGCSQSFYEFALSQIEVPLPTLLEDLNNKRLKPSSVVREYIRTKLSITAPSDSESHLLKPKEILSCLSYLTPAETQYVLLSRYVLMDIPQEILRDETLDLFWDALEQVSASVQEKWVQAAIQYLEKRDRMSFRNLDWQWVERAWQTDPKTLEIFSPQIQERLRFPWAQYLEAASAHGKDDLIFTCLTQMPDERMRAEWIEYLMGRIPEERLRRVIFQLKDEALRTQLEVKWLEKFSSSPSDLRAALEAQLESTAVLNEKPKLLRRLVRQFSDLPEAQQVESIESLDRYLEEMRSLGACDVGFLSEIADMADRLGDWGRSWKWSLQEWFLANETQKLKCLDQFLDRAFRARSMDEAQRLLVEELFQSQKPSPLAFEILDRLLNPNSAFRIKHLRQEFVQRASRLFPLHESLLQAGAQFDYRAYLLWKAFYGEELSEKAECPPHRKRKRFSFWGLIQAVTQPETVSAFTHYLQTLPGLAGPSEPVKNLSASQKRVVQIAKAFKSKKLELRVRSQMAVPLMLHLEDRIIEMHSLFFQQLDEWSVGAITTGFLQMLSDREKGLFEPAALMERFFQGLLLFGAPIENVIRLCTWFAIHESLISSRALESQPEELMAQMPFLNQLLIFYLSADFDRKRAEDGIPLV